MADTTNLPAAPAEKGVGNFLTNKERVLGGIATAGVVAAAGAGLYAVLPTLINFVGMLTTFIGKLAVLGGLGLVVAGVAYVLIQPRTWTMLGYAYARWARESHLHASQKRPDRLPDRLFP